MKGKAIRLTAALVAASGIALAGCASNSSSGNSGSTESAKTVTIGDITDLTGAGDSNGIAENRGAQIAVDQINAAGGIKSMGGAKLKLKVFDTQSNSDLGATEASAAVSDGVTAVIGGTVDATVLAGTNITERAGIPWIVDGAAGNEIVTRGYTTVFSVSGDVTQNVGGWVSVMKQAVTGLGLAHPTVALAYSESTYGIGGLAAFKQAIASTGIKVVTEFGYPDTTTDFSSVAVRLAATHADIIYVLGYPEDGLALLKLFKSTVKADAKVVLLTGTDTTDALTAFGASGANTGLYVGAATPSLPGAPASLQKFYTAYGNRSSANVAMLGYTAVQVLAAALEKAGSSDSKAVLAALPGVELTHDSGNIWPQPAVIKFNSDRAQTTPPFFIAQIIGGKVKMVYPAGAAQSKIVPWQS